MKNISKEHITFFLDLPILPNCPNSGFESKQINLHVGNKYNYWFIQPSEKPLKLESSTFPQILLDNYDFEYLRKLTRDKYEEMKKLKRNGK